jgi:hypothetical protein
MSEPRDAFAAAFAVEMRAPLARVELGASQLARDATTPAARELAVGICTAVAEIDRLISRVLAVLLPHPRPPAPAADLRPVLEDLRERLSPVLSARGVSWEPGPAAGSEVSGDAESLRAVAMALLRVGAELAGSGGCLSLDLRADDGRYGLQLEGRSAGAGTAGGDLGEALRELCGPVLSQGGSVDLPDEGGEIRATVWLPRQEDACGAS